MSKWLCFKIGKSMNFWVADYRDGPFDGLMRVFPGNSGCWYSGKTITLYWLGRGEKYSPIMGG